MRNLVIAYIIAALVTIGAVFYQRLTGPTYPLKTKFQLGNTEYQLKLPRSHSSTHDCEFQLERKELKMEASLIYHRYPTNEPYDTLLFQKEGDVLTAALPMQPPAGKLQYFLLVKNENGVVNVPGDKPVVIRFKGDVPAYILIPHIILMFIAMFLSNLTGILAFFDKNKLKFYSLLTLLTLLIGGLVLGPTVQKFAFGEYWTGVPFGMDLTDNKVLIAFIFWLTAVFLNFRKPNIILTVIASVIMLAVYSIPHSAFGSELNYATGKVVTGFVSLIL